MDKLPPRITVGNSTKRLGKRVAKPLPRIMIRISTVKSVKKAANPAARAVNNPVEAVIRSLKCAFQIPADIRTFPGLAVSLLYSIRTPAELLEKTRYI
ncbi:hypothetical protein D3C80_1805930 [compost metagenome]